MSPPSILYRAHRLRFVIGALVLIPLTILSGAIAYAGGPNGESANPLFVLMVGGIYLWLDYMIVVKLIWPPEVEISLSGIRFSNRAMFASGSFAWSDVDGPEPGSGGSFQYRVPLLVMTANGRTFKIPPSHFGATYDEMAAVIDSARAGHLVPREQWLAEHPRHPFRRWAIEWGIPLAGATILAGIMIYFGR